VGAGEDDRHVAPELGRQAAEIRHGIRPPVVDVGDLEPTRDFIDVRDVAQALSVLADQGAAGATYNVATGTESSIGSVLSTVLKVSSLEGAVEIRRRPAEDIAVRRHFADVRRLRGLGFRPRFDLTESIRDVVSYYTATVASTACEALKSATAMARPGSSLTASTLNGFGERCGGERSRGPRAAAGGG
jgi:GDP-4-dehydro-6-deoxy-D-mannose reductase